ncbi:protein-glutamate methylesterase/protein-glutamine glutaminase [Neobacillus jeddahensis]|uniref:protein-glutamate methylesterase/protein-glutamine glutaminase n=1 Tax=Neobacillus jeddahensis TaxID=1461580 RepID=UPI00058E1358|nr:chemotaxis response regulator protein-glutamate methylesterase [Neobacillus jeddahensis]
MKQYGVLVVDDSAFMRRAVSHIIEEDPQLYVIGIARNGVEAVEKVQRLKPDLVTMDVEMPEMNGIRSLKEIMKLSPVPVVMLSSLTKEGANETLLALEYGAVDFFLKDNLLKNPSDQEQIEEFLQRIKSIVKGKLPSPSPVLRPIENKVTKLVNQNIELIFIGCSTGGPSALQAILPQFPKDFPIPIVVAQHMPAGFTKPLADRFDTLCHLNVREGKDGEEIQAGTIYISPSGYQTRFERKQDGTVVLLIDNHEEGQALYKPCIDISLASAAPIYTNRLLSIILTGMGVDGMEGCGAVKKYQGTVLVEDEESCIVYGMPKAVVQAGYADGQYPLSKIYEEILSHLQ